MKCPYCGGNLSLEDAYCPHCKKPNKQAAKHIADMNEFKEDYSETKASVFSATHLFNRIGIRIIVLCVLCFLIIASLLLKNSSVSIKSSIVKNNLQKNRAAYSAILDGYLDEKNYEAFSAFCSAHSITGYDYGYTKYSAILQACDSYNYLYRQILTLLYADNEYTYTAHLTGVICDDVNVFYHTLSRTNLSFYEGSDSEESLAVLDDLQQRVELMLETFCGLSREECNGLKSMSDAKRAVLIEDKINEIIQ